MVRNYFVVFLIGISFLFLSSRAKGQQIPIMAFHGVQKEFTSEEHFRKMKAAGITISFSIYETNAELAKALDCAQLAGVKLVIYSYDLVNKTKETVLLFRNHPALFGYYINDEPSTDVFGILKSRIDEIKKYDSLHPTYVNLFPNYAENNQFRAASYVDYLSKYLNSVPIDFISFDHYPLMNNKVHPGWYGNLELIRNMAILSKKKFWAFANATVFGPYKQPTVSGLKLQMYSNLLYGAQGLQYFTYWTLNDENWKKNKFGHAIVDSEGNPTVTYDIVKKTNEDIQKYANVFLNSTVQSVFHTSTQQPSDTKKLAAFPSGFSYFNSNKPAIVSYINNVAKRYVVILNKDLLENATLTVAANKGLRYIDYNGSETTMSTSRTKFSIPPGDILVFTY